MPVSFVVFVVVVVVVVLQNPTHFAGCLFANFLIPTSFIQTLFKAVKSKQTCRTAKSKKIWGTDNPSVRSTSVS